MSAADRAAVMRDRLVLALCLVCAPAAWGQTAPGKKELAMRAVQLQMPGIEALARSLVEQPAIEMLRDAAKLVVERVPPDQREAVGKRIQDSARKYVDEAAPIMRERALKLAPQSLGTALEEGFSEDELRQLVAWLESPVSRKFQSALPEMQNAFVQKLLADARPLVDPRLQVLQQSVRSALGLPPPPPAAAARPPTGGASRPAPR